MIYLLDAVSFLMGMTLIIGAFRDWKWLVDPPSQMWSYYSQALLKRLFGRRFLVAYTYFVGFLIVAFSLWVTFAHIKETP